eukprot:25858-Hanusia_phi.AAC.1
MEADLGLAIQPRESQIFIPSLHCCWRSDPEALPPGPVLRGSYQLRRSGQRRRRSPALAYADNLQRQGSSPFIPEVTAQVASCSFRPCHPPGAREIS